MIVALWLTCTLFTAGFLLSRLPEVWRHAVLAWAIVGLAVWLRT